MAYFPDAFLTQMRRATPSTLSSDESLAACQRPLRRGIRVNTLKISIADFLALTAPYNQSLTPVPWRAEGFWIERSDEESVPLGSTAEHLSDLFYIQEASSMLPVTALLTEGNAPEHVMDVAAAPDSKTTQVAAKMDNRDAILASEFSTSRVKVLHTNISHYGTANVALTHFNGRVFNVALPESFDTMLLDVPCSSEDAVREDSDALKNWSIESNPKVTATQRELFGSTFHALCPGGALVCSVCTLNHNENESIMQWSIETYPGIVELLPLDDLSSQAKRTLTPEELLHVFPQIYDCEGSFVARLRKTAATPALPMPKYKVGNFSLSPLKGRESAFVTQTAGAYGLQWEDNLHLWQHDKEIWLFPTDVEPLIGKVRFSRLGIKLTETHSKEYRWQREAAIALTDPNHSHAFELTLAEVEKWYRGRDVYP